MEPREVDNVLVCITPKAPLYTASLFEKKSPVAAQVNVERLLLLESSEKNPPAVPSN
jgi:hypothetical protein